MPPGLNLALPHFAPMPGTTYFVRGWFVDAVGSVHRYVPPTPVTSGSEAGHSTLGYGINVFGPWPTRACFVAFAVPLSPDDPRTVTPLAAESLYANRMLSSDWEFPHASSAEAKLWEMTFARWFFTT